MTPWSSSHVPQFSFFSGPNFGIQGGFWQCLAERGWVCLGIGCWAERYYSLKSAEEIFPNYIHRESYMENGVQKEILFGSPLNILSQPIFRGCEFGLDHKQSIEEYSNILKNGMGQEEEIFYFDAYQGIEFFASLGWAVSVTAAQPPPLHEDTSNQSFSLFGHDSQSFSSSTLSSYNEIQIGFLERIKSHCISFSCSLPALKEVWENLPTFLFANWLFKCYQQAWDCLPDPLHQEREKFESLSQKANDLDSGDDGF